MARRSLLSFALILAGLSILPFTEAQDRTDPRGVCRCVQGASCWPSPEDFKRLGLWVSQPLLRPRPPPNPCYSRSGNRKACEEVHAQYLNGTWRADNPGAMQNVNFEAYISPGGIIEACPLNATAGAKCEQGSIPPIGVDARTVEDIQVALIFARHYNLKIVVKNTGHDYLGRSAGKGGFLIWVHHMKSINVHESFVPLGAPDSEQQPAVTLGAGVQWIEAYRAVHEAGRAIVGGASAGGTVGAASGWVLGGGHSALSPAHGLGVDNVLQFTVVTGEGEHVTANSHTNQDLFWALRGGGGGTFGIVTSTTYKTHPIEPLVTAIVLANLTFSIASDVVTDFLRLHPSLSDAHWGGYAQVKPSLLQAIYISPGKSMEEATASFGPFFSTVSELTNGTALTLLVPYPSFWDWFYAIYIEGTGGGIGQVGGSPEISSRLLNREVVESDPQRVARTLLSVPNPGGVAWNFVGGGAVAQVDPESAGLNPAWRTALAHLYVAEDISSDLSWEAIQALRVRLKAGTTHLDPLSTDSASYLNEASLHEEDFKKSFFGSHYDKLKKIKDEVDPGGLFIVPLGVGSDEWSANYCRVGPNL